MQLKTLPERIDKGSGGRQKKGATGKPDRIHPQQGRVAGRIFRIAGVAVMLEQQHVLAEHQHKAQRRADREEEVVETIFLDGQHASGHQQHGKAEHG